MLDTCFAGLQEVVWGSAGDHGFAGSGAGVELEAASTY